MLEMVLSGYCTYCIYCCLLYRYRQLLQCVYVF